MSDETWPWLVLAPQLPSVRDVYVSGQHLALDAGEMISGLREGSIVFRYIGNTWRAVHAS